MVRGIGGIFFKAADPDALAAWYERHLGVHRDENGFAAFGWRELDAPSQVASTTWSAFSDDTDYFDPSESSWMINYRVDDLDETLARLADEGVELAGEPQAFEYGKFGWVLDPEGNKIELWEPPDTDAFNITVPETDVEGELASGVWLCEPGSTIAATRGGSDREIVRECTVELPVAEVWRLWTTSEGVSEWLVENNRVELRVGGPYEFYFNADGPSGERGGEGCKILSFLPERMLSFTWNAPPHLDHTRSRHTHVVVEFDARGPERTHVRLTHLGWPTDEVDSHPQWPETIAYFGGAWTNVLKALEAHGAG